MATIDLVGQSSSINRPISSDAIQLVTKNSLVYQENANEKLGLSLLTLKNERVEDLTKLKRRDRFNYIDLPGHHIYYFETIEQVKAFYNKNHNDNCQILVGPEFSVQKNIFPALSTETGILNLTTGEQTFVAGPADVPAKITQLLNNTDNQQYLYLIYISDATPATSIGESDFESGNINAIRISSKITTIGANAFKKCTSLKKIIIDKPIDSIEGAPWGAPKECDIDWMGINEDKINYVDYDEGVTSYFNNLTALKTFCNQTQITSGYIVIGNNFDTSTIFVDKQHITLLNLNDGTTKIVSYPADASAIMKNNPNAHYYVHMGDNVSTPTTIGADDFTTDNLSILRINSGITHIAKTSFERCTSLQKIIIDKSQGAFTNLVVNNAPWGAPVSCEVVWKTAES